MCRRINPRDRQQSPRNRKLDECDRNEVPRREDKVDNLLVPSDPVELDVVANLKHIKGQFRIEKL